MNHDLLILTLEVLFFYILVLGFHALRRRITYIPLLTLLGGMTAIMYWVTAASVSVDVYGISFFVSSTIFYTSFLLGVFIIYLFDGPIATRNSIIVIVAVSIMVPLISLGLKFQSELSGSIGIIQVPMPELRVILSSIIATLLDLIFLATFWEYLSKSFSKIPLFLRVYLTLLGVMWLDVILFGTGAFAGTEYYIGFLRSTLLSRLIISLFTFPILMAYIVWQNTREKLPVQARPAWHVLKEVAITKSELHSVQRDLLEQKQGLVLLRESERRYRHLFEYSPIAMWEEDFTDVKNTLDQIKAKGVLDIKSHLENHPELVSKLTQQVKIIDVNHAAIELLQASTKSEVMKNLDNIFTEESVETFKAEMLAISNDERGFESETVLKTIQGHKRIVILKLIRLYSDDGNYSRVLVVNTDITEIKSAEIALKSSEERYRDLFEKSDDAILIIKDGKFVDCNDAAVTMLKYADKAEFLNTHPSILSPKFQPDGLSSFEKADAMINESILKGSHRFEWQHRKKNGEDFPVEVLLTSILTSDNERIIHTVWRDITVRKQIEFEKINFEKQILQTQKLESLGVLAGGIAHDFNNILMGILGYSDLALNALNPGSPAKEFIEGISSSSRKAADLIKQMLAYSGKGKFTLQAIDLNVLIEDTVQMLKISISKNAVLKYNYSREVVVMEGDPSQIRQIIMNLVINASEAIEKNSGMIALSTGLMYCDQTYIDGTGFESNVSREEPLTEGHYAYIEVSDTGTGMSRETLSKIFDPFFTTKFTGRGLGLSAVLGIARGHRGMVKIYSEEGRGSTFKVLFPVLDDHDSPTVVTDAVEEQGENWHKEGTFLVADDEESVRTIGKHMIQQLGFEVITANDGQEAIELFSAHKEEIVGVLLDLTMPHKDGAQVFQEIRKLNPDVKVILSSGYNKQDATQQFIGKGLAGFIQKPYISVDLQNKIKEIF